MDTLDTLFGSLRHVFAMANKTQMIWCGAVLLSMLLLAVLHHKWREDWQKLGRWRLLCLIPLLICAVHAWLYVRGFPMAVSMFIPLYAIAVLALIPMPFAKRKIGYGITAFITGLLTVLCGFYFCGSAPNLFNESQKSYTESFRSLVKHMDKTYVLKEWKGADFAALEAKYLPAVQTAEQEQDAVKFMNAVQEFTNELHDGHIYADCQIGKEEEKQSAFHQHEYGLAMVQLDSGEVIAVCTAEDVNKLGIEDGTVITQWNGKPVLQAAAEDVPDYGIPVKSNADRLAPLYLSALGGDTVDVTFLDKSGNEQTVTLSDLGECRTAHEAMDAFSHAPKIESPEDYQALLDQNFSAKMLDDKCGYLILTAETLSSDLLGLKNLTGYLTGNQKYAREIFRTRLNELKAQGMEYLVIDLRNNMGGFDEIGCALCDLLTDREWYGQGLGIRKNGQYTCVSDHGVHGTGEFKDLPVVALTNYNCASAGDGTSLYLSKLPNVTLAGITDPCGCNQETGGMCVLSGGVVTVGFPAGLVMDETGVPNVDTRADRISRNPVEERIPLDLDAAMAIFRDKKDYELDWAIQYLENGQ